MNSKKSYEIKTGDCSLHYLTPSLGIGRNDIIYSVISYNTNKANNKRNKVLGLTTENSSIYTFKTTKLPPIFTTFIRNSNAQAKPHHRRIASKPNQFTINQRISLSKFKRSCSRGPSHNQTNWRIANICDSFKKSNCAEPRATKMNKVPDSESEREMENNAIINKWKICLQ
jgi:hypothetical protein